jgi:Holliday junction resolvase RusA-like endonuclease
MGKRSENAENGMCTDDSVDWGRADATHTNDLSVYVRGTPRPQPRPRFVGGRVVSTVSAGAKAWRAAVTTAARRAVQSMGGVSGPVSLGVRFDMPTREPGRWGKPHAMRPDADNLLKLVMDCLTRAGVWGDDCQVVAVQCYKVWARDGGAAVVITQAADQD